MEKASADESFPATEWVLQDAGSLRVTISFTENGTLSGQGPCNRYFAELRMSPPRIHIGNIGSTHMMCPDIDTETNYFRALGSVEWFEISAGNLTLLTNEIATLTYKQN
ncbi:MAG: META domain-containing protein [Paracoccaceae bacterium]